jgi:3-oxoacyl-[acyl-carrier-protein] synthase II
MSRQLRRVVVTGLGVVSPLGVGAAHTWSRLVAGHSGVTALNLPSAAVAAFAVANRAPVPLPCQVAAHVPRDGSATGAFDCDLWVPAAIRSSTADFVHFGLSAAAQALSDARLPSGSVDPDRMGVALGSGVGSLHDIATRSFSCWWT